MNKILSVNIGGMIFQLDEEAFEILKSYIDSIRLHFSRTEGSHEITSDIESRIAEMLQSKLHANKQAINKTDVEEIVAAMGKPEEFGDAANDDESSATGTAYTSAATGEPVFKTTRKRLFRDTDHSMIGGVCSGIAAYMGTDPIWIRLIFLLVFFTFGTGLLIYVILWIIMPKAKTITDKLEMRGENITISNIERSVKEELGDLKKNFNSFQSSATGQQIKSRASDFGNLLVQIGRYIFKFVVKFAGVLFILFGIILLGTLIFAYFGFFPAFMDFPIMVFPKEWQHIVAATGALFFIGLPLLFLIILGFRVVFNIRYQNKAFLFSFLGLWIVSLFTVLVAGGFLIKNYSTISVKKESIKLDAPASDTLTLSLTDAQERANDEYTYRFGLGGSMVVSHKEILSRNVNLDIEKSESGELELLKVVEVRGKSYDDKDKNVQAVNYSFRQNNDSILFNKYYGVKEYKPWRMQDLKLVLRVPVGKVLKLDNNMQYFLYDVDNVTDTWDQDMAGHSWQMTKEGLKCLDCNFDEMEHERFKHPHYHHGDDEDDDVDIKIDGKDGEIKIQEKSKEGKNNVSIKFSSL